MEITSGMSRAFSDGGELPIFMARPAGSGVYPAVIVLMEAFGLNDNIKFTAERLAAEGFVVAAPDLYYRAGSAVVPYDDLPQALRLMNSLSDDQILKDMNSVVQQLQSDPMVRVDRIGVTGFCMGGRVAFLAACQISAIKAAVPFYGGGIASVRERNERTPKAPLEYADQLKAPMLLFFGAKDAFIPTATVDQIRDRLNQLGKQAEVVVYDEADHGFFCDERPSYNAAAANDAWQRMLAFFSTHLKD